VSKSRFAFSVIRMATFDAVSFAQTVAFFLNRSSNRRRQILIGVYVLCVSSRHRFDAVNVHVKILDNEPSIFDCDITTAR
jgi:hypothetical protein